MNLSKEYKVIYMRFQERKTVEQICKELDMSYLAVKNIIMKEVFEIEYWRVNDGKPVYDGDAYLSYWPQGKKPNALKKAQ